MASSGNSNNEQEACDSACGKKTFHRHSSHQIHTLEAFFKECPHPDENQRQKLSKELGLEPKQIKFWFQNKRTQTKAQSERMDNSLLRAENEKIRCENLAIKEALKNVICPSCGGPPFGEEERKHSLQKLKLENVQLKKEHENVSVLLSKYRSGSTISASMNLPTSSLAILPINVPALKMELGSLANCHDSEVDGNDIVSLPYEFKGVLTEMERALMYKTAASAMDELIMLLQMNEPLWTKSPYSNSDGKIISYVIQRDSYDKAFPKPTHFTTPNARFESSKDSTLIAMPATQLVDIFLNVEKWVDLFSTIVTKAKTIQILEIGMVGNRNGSLQLMYEEMHILSPFVPPREFYFLRHCQQIAAGVWVIVDVSYSFLKETNFYSWKLPSGCMIQEMPNGFSKVTWVEHVQVVDKIQTHRLYRDLICGGLTYGSKRWVLTLQRMCERISISNIESKPTQNYEGEGRRSIMKLGHRMVKSFCSMLNMSCELDFPQLAEENNSGVRVCVRQSKKTGQPKGEIVSAATSLWLPLPCHNVFALLNDEKMRPQWDVLCNGNPVNEISNISTGNIPGNFISIIKPFVPSENNMVILQEICCNESLENMVVYAPISKEALNKVINGDGNDCLDIAILPSGFVISGDGCHEVEVRATSTRSSGSLVTIAFQILVSTTSSSKDINVQSVATVNALISSTVQRIKAMLNCFNLD